MLVGPFELGTRRARTIPARTDPGTQNERAKWKTRPITGHLVRLGPRRLWMSEVRELVRACDVAFVHVARVSDFASQFANAGDRGLAYKPAKSTLYLQGAR